MQDAHSELQQEIKSFNDGVSTLVQTRNLALQIGKQKFAPGVPVLLQLLQHEDEIVRYNAVMSLGFKLRFRDATCAFFKVLENDPDADCRDAAAGALSAMWRNTRDRRIIEELASVALNDQDEDVRKAAYSALVAVNGISDEGYLEMLRSDRQPVDPTRVAAILAGYTQ